MTGVLLQQVQQDSSKRRRRCAVPALPGLSDVVEAVAPHYLTRNLCLLAKMSNQGGELVVGAPAVISLVGPRVGQLPPGEAPLQPPTLDVT